MKNQTKNPLPSCTYHTAKNLTGLCFNRLSWLIFPIPSINSNSSAHLGFYAAGNFEFPLPLPLPTQAKAGNNILILPRLHNRTSFAFLLPLSFSEDPPSPSINKTVKENRKTSRPLSIGSFPGNFYVQSCFLPPQRLNPGPQASDSVL